MMYLDLFFWWIGCSMSCIGGLGIFVTGSFWIFDKIYTRLGYTKEFLVVYKRMLMERRKEWPAS